MGVYFNTVYLPLFSTGTLGGLPMLIHTNVILELIVSERPSIELISWVQFPDPATATTTAVSS